LTGAATPKAWAWHYAKPKRNLPDPALGLAGAVKPNSLA